MSAFNKLYILDYGLGEKTIIYAEDEKSFLEIVEKKEISLPNNITEIPCLLPGIEFGELC